ncbi:MAG TPA: hypothetical protein VK936_14400 [Longimicrobiales bacterium]|nr:hypothetical protein [Longimicrobiales bacterium]
MTFRDPKVPRSRPVAPVVRAAATLAAGAILAGCAGRSTPLPDIGGGDLLHIVVEAALAGVPDPAARDGGSLLLDSLSVPRLGVAAGGDAFSGNEVARQVRRPVTLVDPADVLECPSRQPCRVRGDAVYVTIWEAERTIDGVSAVVARTYNIQGLHPMTRSAVHRIRVVRDGAGWRLAAFEAVPS